MEILFFTEDIVLPEVDFDKLNFWINQIIQEEGEEGGDINFIFCSDKYLLDINQKYLNHDYFTDVITFDYSDGDLISGDVFISYDRIVDNAKSFKIEVEEEFRRICVHGVLHLLKYNDKLRDEKIEMTSKENFYLNKYK